MKKLFTTLMLVLLACGASFAASVAQQADAAYSKADYKNAIQLYQQSLQQDGLSAVVLYNLGNAYYRDDKLGKAILNYERALRVDPTFADARTNLEFVNTKIQDKPEDDTPFFITLHNGVIAAMGANAWAWCTFAVFIILLGAVALYIFSTNVGLRKTGFFGAIVLLFVFIYFLNVAYDAAQRATTHESAIVTASNTQLSSAPRANANGTDKVVTIHEGTRVEIVDSVATPDDPRSPKWFEVKINNATRAWLRATDVERI